MHISGVTHLTSATSSGKNGHVLPVPASPEPKQGSSFIRDLAASVDPKNMSRQESLALANALMKAGEGELSTVFLPPPLLKVNEDGSITDMTGTQEGDEIMSRKFNMFDYMNDRIEYREHNDLPTKLHEQALAFLEKLEVANATTGVDDFA